MAPEVAAKPKNRPRRRALYWALLLAIAVALPLFALRDLGQWLQVDEPLQHSGAIVVLGGGLPFRAMEAASLYRSGWAKEVWLTKGAPNEGDRALEKLGLPPTGEYLFSEAVLQKLGVPIPAIHVIPEPVNNTLAEVRAIRGYAQSVTPAGATSPVILVTSKYHSRRVRVIWDAVTRGGMPAVIRYAPLESYDAGKWWRTTTDAMATFREAFGILDAWAGFPIAPRE